MDNIYKDIAKKYNLPVEVIKNIYESYYEFIRETIKNITIEDLVNKDGLRASFNIPSIGKLYCNKNKLKKIKENAETYRKIR